jgi:hypothetical protein
MGLAMTLLCKFLLPLVLLATALNAQQKPPVYKSPPEKLPVAVAPQPIAFSHKKHVALGLGCPGCHESAAEKDEAGLPQAEKCMLCHKTMETENPEIKKLATLTRRGEKIKWVRLYRLPDFVFFSHANHLKAQVKCEACHGPVADRDVLSKEVSTNMVACMNCHAARKAPLGCAACHQLGH